MNLDFTSEQELLRDSARKFLSKECPYARVKELEESEKGYDPNLWAKMAELGWLGWLFPEEYGGFGGEFIDMTIIQEEIGRAVFPSPFFSTVIQCGLLILEGGSEEQKKKYLPEIAEGGLILALAQYEKDGSYLPGGIKMTAEVKGDGYVLNGTKLFVMDANVADYLIVVARTSTDGPSLFMVDAKDPGVSIVKMPTIGKDNNCEVIFNNVVASKDGVIGPLGGGWEILEKMNVKASTAKAAEMIGGCRACIDITAAYAREREQYGRPIGGYQAIQHYMANMLLAYDSANAFLYKTAGIINRNGDCSIEPSVIKACANESYKYISERAVQIHGGIGTTRECDIGLFYRKAKAFEYICGNADYHYEKIAQALLA